MSNLSPRLWSRRYEEIFQWKFAEHRSEDHFTLNTTNLLSEVQFYNVQAASSRFYHMDPNE